MTDSTVPAARRAIRNTVWTVASELGTRALGFVAVVYLAARLGAGGFGMLGFAQAVMAYFALFSEFGLRILGTRTLSRERDRLGHLVAPFVWARLLLLALGVVALAALWLGLRKPLLVKELIVLYWLSLIPAAFYLDWVYLALEDMAAPALANLGRAALYLGLVLLYVHDSTDVLGVAGANLAGALAASVGLAAAFVFRHGWPRPSRGKPLRLIAQSVPIGIGAVMVQIYYNLDTICLGLMRTDAEVGCYTAAYKIVLVIFALGGAFPQMLFPVLSRAFHEEAAQARRLFQVALRLTLVGTVPLVVGGILLADDLLRAVYSAEFAAAGPAFRVLLATLFFMLVGNLYAQAVLASDRQRRFVIVVTIGAVLNTALNLVVIPRWGMLGAASATLATEIIVFGGMNASLPRGCGRLFAELWRPLACAVPMGAVVFALRPWGLAPAIGAAVPVYLGLAFLTGALRRDDLQMLRR